MLEQLQKEANAVNRIYNRMNQNENRSSFYDWCAHHNRKDLLEQWDFENNLFNLGITVHTISKSSSVRPYWYCEKHHISYQCRIDTKVRDLEATQCSQCLAEKRRRTTIKKKGSLLDWCKENGEYGQQLLKEWNTEKNQQELYLNMKNINYNSTRTVYWKCITCGNEWKAKISVRTLGKSGKCPQCINRNRSIVRHAATLKTNNFAIWCQNNGEIGEQLLKEWDTKKNKEYLNLTMEQITPYYAEKVYWKCEEGHEFQVTPYYRTYYKSICPKCNHKSKHGKTLQETHPALIKEWDYSKNEKLPQEYTAWVQERVWWKCPECGHEWQSMISGRAQQGTGCPKCHHNWAS